MTDERPQGMQQDLPQNLPIVYRPGPRGAAIMMAVGVAFVALGIYAIMQNSSVLVGPPANLPRPRTSSTFFGWLALIGGLVVVVAGWMTLKSGRPTLELNAWGIVATGRFGGVRQWAWDDIERIEVKRFERPSPLGNANLDSLVLVLRTGGKAGLMVPGDVAEVKAAMERVRG